MLGLRPRDELEFNSDGLYKTTCLVLSSRCFIPSLPLVNKKASPFCDPVTNFVSALAPILTMKFLVNCLTVTVALAVPAFAAFTVIPGKTAIAYCSSNPTPQHDNCEKAIAKISDDGDYVEGDEFQAGDCSVAILNQGQHGPYIKGVDFKYMASSILENGCYGDGWGIVGGLNVRTHLGSNPGHIVLTLLLLGHGAPMYRVHVRHLHNLQRSHSPLWCDSSPARRHARC